MAELSLVPVEPTPDEVGRLVDRLVELRFLGLYGGRLAARAAAEAMVERLRPQLRLVEAARVGRAWVFPEGVDLGVLDVELPDLAAAGTLRGLLADLSRAEDRAGLTASVRPGDPAREAFVRDGGFQVVATQMRLDLGTPPAPEERVRLRTMTEAEYASWFDGQVETYARERQDAGEPAEAAVVNAQETFAELLPAGLASPDQHLFVGLEGETVVGHLWIGTNRPTHWVYDVVVRPSQRRQGLGAALMRAGARWSHAAGAAAIGLNVFGHNSGARALYDRLGYEVTEVVHRLDLR